MTLPWSVLCAALAAACAALLGKVVLLRRAADDIGRELAYKLACDTNTLISVSTRDRAMRRLADRLNRELRLLRQERRRFQQGDRDVKETITNVSHDLRTPLTAVCGYLDLLENEEKSENAVRYLALIGERTQALKQLTEELFRYSMAQSLDMQAEEVCLNAALEDCIAAYYAALLTAGITPRITMPECRVMRRLNRVALSRVLSNIVSNAIKYSDGDLEVYLSGAGEITFTNTASGLTEMQVNKLFHRYYTVETGNKATGVGLSIAKTLVEQMGGEITGTYHNRKLSVCIRLALPVVPHA